MKNIENKYYQFPIIILILISLISTLVNANGGGAGSFFWIIMYLPVFISAFLILLFLIWFLRKYMNPWIATIIASLIFSITINFIRFIGIGRDIIYEDIVGLSIVPGFVLFFFLYSIIYIIFRLKQRRFAYFKSSPFLAVIGILLTLMFIFFGTKGMYLTSLTTENCNLNLDSSSEERCIDKIYLNSPSYERCDSIPFSGSFSIQRIKCFTNLAIAEGDLSICGEILKGQGIEAFCKSKLAEFLKDPEICEEESMGPESEQAICYFLVAKSTNNRSICERIKAEIEIDSMLLEIYDPSLRNIYGNSLRDFCFSYSNK